MMELTHPEDRVLDRLPSRDPRRAAHPFAPPRTVIKRKRAWHPHWRRIDQGREGDCVGFSITNEFMCTPRIVVPADPKRYAHELTDEAKRHDPWYGEDYEGTSVDAGAWVARDRGLITGWKWVWSVEDLIQALILPASEGGGPIIMGTNWYDSMYYTRPSGLVDVSGRIVGGHAFMVYGYHPGIRLHRESWTQRFEVFKFMNSWGPAYGRNGAGYIRIEDMDRLLREQGEACVFIGRQSA